MGSAGMFSHWNSNAVAGCSLEFMSDRIRSIASMNMKLTMDRPRVAIDMSIGASGGSRVTASSTCTWTFGVAVRLRLRADLTGVGRGCGVARDADDRVRFSFDGDFIVCLRYLLACDGCT